MHGKTGGDKMDIYGKTKWTALEKTLAQLASGEAMGGGMYYALARIAEHLGDCSTPGGPALNRRVFL